MAKANYICECGYSKIVNFKPGEKIGDIICDNCGKQMSRQYNQINVGYIEEDDLLKTGMMMTYHSANKVR